MAAKRPLNVGLVGCGFMGRTHSNAWGKVNQFFELEYQPVLKAVCARNPEEVQGFAEQWGYESTETDWRALVARDDIDLIDIASPNDTHAEIAVAEVRQERAGVVDADLLHLLRQRVLALLDERLRHGVDGVQPAVEPQRRVDAVRQQVAGDAAAGYVDVETPERRAALRQIL